MFTIFANNNDLFDFDMSFSILKIFGIIIVVFIIFSTIKKRKTDKEYRLFLEQQQIKKEQLEKERIERHKRLLQQEQELALKRKERLKNLTNNKIEISPREFLNNLNGMYSSNNDFTGVYILHNLNKDKYYVGQGKKVFARVKAHFTGHGNGDVYADYKYGDVFSISMISLVNSGYNSIDELEKQMIFAYDAYTKGYNRTRGNRR